MSGSLRWAAGLGIHPFPALSSYGRSSVALCRPLAIAEHLDGR
jgi:hypothetical protein